MRAKKRFGQNFLQDHNILRNMVAAIAPQATDHLLEIGPGRGALTDYLAPSCKTLDLVEIDRDLAALLKDRYAEHNHISLHEADILQFDLSTLTDKKKSLRVIGNLPYNISTPLLFRLMDFSELIVDMYFLLQKEVVDRITAKVNSKHYGRLGIMTQYYCQSIKLFDVPPTAFIPQPKVDSAYVQMIPRDPKALNAHNVSHLSDLVRTAFMQRRKTIQNSLKKMVSSEQLNAAGIDPKMRPQEITLEQYVTLSNATVES